MLGLGKRVVNAFAVVLFEGLRVEGFRRFSRVPLRWWVLVLGLGALGPLSAAEFPLRVGPTQRYLVDALGQPFLLHADTPWSLMVALSTNEVETYLETRRTQGFNAIIVNLIEHEFGGVDNSFGAPKNRNGDGPFLTPQDFATPNEAYFKQADWVIERAANKG